MNDDCVFYLCPVCFEASERRITCHGRWMIKCEPGQPGDNCRKPVTDNKGHLKSREPYWFLAARGWLAGG